MTICIATAGLSGCGASVGEEDICAAAAQHVAACLDDPSLGGTEAFGCEPALAQEYLDLSCSQVLARVTGAGKADDERQPVEPEDQIARALCASALFLPNTRLPSRMNGGKVELDFVGRIRSIGDRELSYDAFGRVASIGGVAVKYDWAGRPVRVNDAPIEYGFFGRVAQANGMPVRHDFAGRVSEVNGQPVEYDFNGVTAFNGEPVEYAPWVPVNATLTRRALCLAVYAGASAP